MLLYDKAYLELFPLCVTDAVKQQLAMATSALPHGHQPAYCTWHSGGRWENQWRRNVGWYLLQTMCGFWWVWLLVDDNRTMGWIIVWWNVLSPAWFVYIYIYIYIYREREREREKERERDGGVGIAQDWNNSSAFLKASALWKSCIADRYISIADRNISILLLWFFFLHHSCMDILTYPFHRPSLSIKVTVYAVDNF